MIAAPANQPETKIWPYEGNVVEKKEYRKNQFLLKY